MLDREGPDLGALELHHVAGLEFDQVELEPDPADQPAEGLEEVVEPRAARQIVSGASRSVRSYV